MDASPRVVRCGRSRAGVGLGCIASGATQVNQDMMVAAAEAVAGKLTKAELAQGSVLPDVKRIRCAARLHHRRLDPVQRRWTHTVK